MREQLRIAAGEELGYDQEAITFEGSAIEARLYAEDPANDFLPATGTLFAFEYGFPDVRWDTGVAEGSVVGTDFDPMLAKVIAHAPTRREAAGRLALALENLHIGGVTTNRDFLATTLRRPEFLDGDTTTDFIQRVKPDRSRPHSAAELRQAAVAATLWLQGENRRNAGALGMAPSGWRNAVMPPEKLVLQHGEAEITVRYQSQRDGTFRLDEDQTATIYGRSEYAIDLEVGGIRAESEISTQDAKILVSIPGGDIEFVVLPRFVLPGTEASVGGLTAPMPGKVIEVRVSEGDTVQAGDTLLLLEAMKMEHPIQAPQDGKVTELRVATGDQVENGALLLVVDDPEGNE